MNKGKWIALIIAFALAALVLANRAYGQAPTQDTTTPIPIFSTQDEAVNWLNDRGLDYSPSEGHITIEMNLQTTTVTECDQIPPIQRNPGHTGPLNQNSGHVIVFNGYWITDQNRLCLQIGSDWWGYNMTPVRLYGMVTLRFAEDDTFIYPIPFDINGTPDVDLVAIQQIFSYQFELGHKPVRGIWEGNILMEGAQPATKVVSTVVYPNSGSVRLEKTGKPIEDTVWELLKLNLDGSRTLVERIEIAPHHIQPDGSAKLTWKNLSGPLESTAPNYILQERIDIQPGPMRVIPRDLDTGEETWTWYLNLDASRQTATVQAYNPLHELYLPLCFKSGPDGPIEVPCPQDVADVTINGVTIRRDDDATKTGYSYALPTLHPEQQVGFHLGKLLDKGYVPQLVQLYVDNKPYGHYDVQKRDHIFTTMISGGDERSYQLNAYKLYVFHVQIIVGYTAQNEPIYCYIRYLIYVDPPETH